MSAGKLWRECEDAKRTLSARQKAAVACDYRGVSARIEIAREQFEEATQDLLDRTRFTTVQALKAAGLDWKDLDRVLLVGGSTRMPMVREMLRQLSRQGARRLGGRRRGGGPRRRPARRADPGPAGRAGRRMFKISNVNSHSLGVVGIDPHHPPAAATASSSPATPACRSPASGPSRRRRPASGRSSSRSSRAKAPRPTTARRSAAARSATCRRTCRPQSPVDVLFHYEPNGRLKVRVTVPGTDRKVDHRDRPREQPEQGAPRRLAASHLRPAADRVSVARLRPRLQVSHAHPLRRLHAEHSLRLYASIAAIVSRPTGRITPRSQMIAAISSAGVTSKAGL